MIRRLAIASTVTLVACGGAAAPPAAPPAASAPGAGPSAEPSTIEEAQQQIADARASLSAPPPRAEEPAKDVTRPAPMDAPKAGATKKSESSDDDKRTSSSCQSTCRAIASMRRAVGALCRMTGDADARCSDAKRTLQESELRVATCGC